MSIISSVCKRRQSRCTAIFLITFLILSFTCQNSNAFKIGASCSSGSCGIRRISSRSSSQNIRMTAASMESVTISQDSAAASGIWGKVQNSANIMYKFSRPHTIKGTILASIMGVTRALIENPGTLNFNLIPRAVIGLTALLCGNAYIVGINQIYDVKIDEINKPDLPIAAKQLSTSRAWAIVLACLFAGVGIVKTQFSSTLR